jgi:hypothetical protein
MHVAVDQSRKVEQSGSTVLAYSNHRHRTILVPAYVKQRVLHLLRAQGREWATAVHLVFAALLALLVYDVIGQISSVIIDDEYTGHRGVIKGQTLYHLCKLGIEVQSDVIAFGNVGKSSPAHRLALSVFRGQEPADHCVTFDELWRLME